MEYNPQKIEPKWQKKWEKSNLFKAEDKSKKPKFYCLDMFPYPSGAGLHVGHPRGYIATDIFYHFMQLKGYNVLHPMGWDAFGLPAENYAIKTGIHPEVSTEQNIEKFRSQMKAIGLVYDWSREVNTTDPNYYKWTQWIFLKLFEKGLAYEAVLPINWCPSCKTGLANEEVVAGKCDRCGTQVVKKDVRQWVLKITAYAERLLEDLDGLDWPEKIIMMQKNWIGKSEGANVDFRVDGISEKIKVFTTRPDTLFGATFMVLSPEHPLVEKIIAEDKRSEIEKYQKQAREKSDLERTDLAKEKTGVFTGAYAINPVNNEKIPIWIADYVLMSYGYGAIMSVPAHDQRDWDFAKKYGLEIREVIAGGNVLKEAYVEEGTNVNSDFINGLKTKEASQKMTKWLEDKNIGKKAVNYKLRDWIFSRQRYWGEPIPLVHCEKCGVVPLPEKELPLRLPKVKNYQPTGTGESPLADISDWVNTKCPKCKGPAKRETNTMPQWAGSCWYFLRYVDPKNEEALIDPEKSKYWLPVDLYVGGAEHAVLHLLYSRFWIKVLHDVGALGFREPFLKLKNQGLIMAPDGQKMSKSKGNVINPDDIIKKYGADTLRFYEMFMGPFEDIIAWDTKGIEGCSRFFKRFWNFVISNLKTKEDSKESLQVLNKLIKKVGEDIKSFKFNTAVSAFMGALNGLEKQKISKGSVEKMLILISPLAPHIAEELWEAFGHKESVFSGKWPEYDENLIKEETINLIIQINSRIRDKMEVSPDISKEEAERLTFQRTNVIKWIQGKEVKKVVFIPGKLINIVV